MNTLLLQTKSEQAKALCKVDKQLAKLIHVVGDMEIPLRKNYYEALVKAIISQQISVKAAATIYGRLMELVQKDVTPSSIGRINDEELRNSGVSKQKVAYLRDLTEKFKQIDISSLESMPNTDVIKTLTSIKGIGKWTAEIFLLFSLGRIDVLPVDDVGLHRAVKWLYSEPVEANGKKALQARAAIWSGMETVASIYLWEAVNRQYVIQYSHIDELYK